jgi:hypothetical protein
MNKSTTASTTVANTVKKTNAATAVAATAALSASALKQLLDEHQSQLASLRAHCRALETPTGRQTLGSVGFGTAAAAATATAAGCAQGERGRCTRARRGAIGTTSGVGTRHIGQDEGGEVAHHGRNRQQIERARVAEKTDCQTESDQRRARTQMYSGGKCNGTCVISN